MSDKTDWPARYVALAEADGDELAKLCEVFDADWKAEYSTAFVQFAVGRGWRPQDAAEWSAEIAGEALLSSAGHDDCPRKTAEADVRVCELESA